MSRVGGVVGLIGSALLFGFLLGMMVNESSSFRSVWIDSWLRMSAGGSPGTSPYLVVHDGAFDALAVFVRDERAVLSLSRSDLGYLAFITVRDDGAAVVDRLEREPYVRLVLRNRVPFLCH